MRTVLEGSVRKAGDRLRIIVQLVDAEGGYHLWSERYDRRAEGRVRHPGRDRGERGPRAERGAQRPGARRAPAAAHLEPRGLRVLSQGPPLPGAALAWTCASRRRCSGARSSSTRGSPWPTPGLAEAGFWLYSWWGGASRRPAARPTRPAGRALELAPELAEVHVARGAALSLGRRYDEAAAEFDDRHPAQPAAVEHLLPLRPDALRAGAASTTRRPCGGRASRSRPTTTSSR